MRPRSPVAVAHHLEDMGFLDVPVASARQVSDKLAATQEPVFLPIEEHDYHWTDVVLLDQARTFEANGDRAGVVVGSGRTWDRVVMCTELKAGSP